MTHPDDDQLLKLVLQLLEDHERQALDVHLASCEECRQRWKKIERDTASLGGIVPRVELLRIPLPRSRPLFHHPILKVAALLAIGFLCGFAVADFLRPEPVTVVPSYLIGSPPADSLARHPATDATAVTLTS